MNDKPSIKPTYIPPLKKICMTIGQLPSSYLETMSYYEMLVWFVEYLRNTIIPTIDNNSEAVTELQNLFVELENYVNNYFDNNFPELIDEKIDELVEDGTIANLLNNYAGLLKIYNTYSDMCDDTTLSNGQKVKTMGYYSINDGGGAEYYITTSEPASGYYEEISTGIYASLIIGNQINFRQLGAKTYNEDSTFDNKDIIDKYMSICNAYDKTFELFIPGGKWCFSETLINRPKGVRIVGDKTWAYSDIYGSAILPLENNQQYIWKLGGLADYTDYSTALTISQMVKSSRIDGLCFTTMNGADDTRYSVSQGVFIIDRSEMCTFDNIYLWKFSGNGLVITSSWELDFGLLSIRQHSNPLTYSIVFDRTKPVTNVSVNISDLTIDKLYFERNDNYIISNVGSGFSHNFINYLNIETKFTSVDNTWDTSEATEEEIAEATPVYIFRGFSRYFTIGTINLTFNESNLGIIYDNQKYYMKAILCDNYSLLNNIVTRDRQFNVDVSNLVTRYSHENSLLSIIYSINMAQLSHIHIGSLTCEDNVPKVIVDAFQSGNIRIGSLCANANSYNTSDIVTGLIPAWKHAHTGTSHGGVTYLSGSPSEYNLVCYKDTEASSIGIRFNYYGFSDSEHLQTLKVLCKNMTEEDITLRVSVKHSGADYIYRSLTIPASAGWVLLEQEFWADYGTSIDFKDYGGVAYAGFNIE